MPFFRLTLGLSELSTRRRCKDLAAHNALLHQHLEEVTSQASRIKQVADSSTLSTSHEGDVDENASTKLFELRSVVSYLRKEKEIVDLQLELGKQENTRLKVQIEHLSQSLQETRATLAEVGCRYLAQGMPLTRLIGAREGHSSCGI